MTYTFDRRYIQVVKVSFRSYGSTGSYRSNVSFCSYGSNGSYGSFCSYGSNGSNGSNGSFRYPEIRKIFKIKF